MNDQFTQTHRRYNPLTGEWVLVAPGRLKRPWQGKVERLPAPTLPAYDPGCYLCPGNMRAGGMENPKYASTFVFDNDFSSLSHDPSELNLNERGILRAEAEHGICRVICFSPRHDLTLAEMEIESIRDIVNVWKKEYDTLGKLDDVRYVQIFENKGELMGCSNPHPHCQVWAESSIPVEPAKETLRLETYNREKGKCILCEYLDIELRDKERLVFENDGFAVVVPFWATWPFEAMIISKRHIQNLSQFDDGTIIEFASALKHLTVRYDNLFEVSFPYSSGIHQSPTDGLPHQEWHFHMHFYPPLLRSATVKKFMVGYEMMANPQRDLTAELAAARLRETSDKHYKFIK
jgi:UDPglucose--hexose-1-phosphate uridylyltransferase